MFQIVKCWLGKHRDSDLSNWRSVPGAREAKMCFHCGKYAVIRKVSIATANKQRNQFTQ